MKKLNHPYVIKLYEVIENEDFYFIVLEYASEGDLFELIY